MRKFLRLRYNYRHSYNRWYETLNFFKTGLSSAIERPVGLVNFNLNENLTVKRFSYLVFPISNSFWKWKQKQEWTYFSWHLSKNGNFLQYTLCIHSCSWRSLSSLSQFLLKFWYSAWNEKFPTRLEKKMIQPRYFLHTFGSARVLPLRFVPRAWYNFNIHNNQWRTTSIQSTDTSTHRKTWKCYTDLPGNHRPRIGSHGKEPRTTKGGLRLLQENSSRKLDTDRSRSYKGRSVFIPATTNHVTYFDHGDCVWR